MTSMTAFGAECCGREMDVYLLISENVLSTACAMNHSVSNSHLVIALVLGTASSEGFQSPGWTMLRVYGGGGGRHRGCKASPGIVAVPIALS